MAVMYEVENTGGAPKRLFGKKVVSYDLKVGQKVTTDEGYLFRGIPHIKITRIEGTEEEEKKMLMPDGQEVIKLNPSRIDMKIEKNNVKGADILTESIAQKIGTAIKK